jgi:hypothetical protein
MAARTQAVFIQNSPSSSFLGNNSVHFSSGALVEARMPLPLATPALHQAIANYYPPRHLSRAKIVAALSRNSLFTFAGATAWNA